MRLQETGSIDVIWDRLRRPPDSRLGGDVQASADHLGGCTFEFDGARVVVLNPLRSPGRQASDLAHELSHVILQHELTEIREIAGAAFRTCRADQEEEATNLGATLLLPRTLLLRAATRGIESPQAVAEEFGVTEELARLRLNRTGVVKQIARGRRRLHDAGSRAD